MKITRWVARGAVGALVGVMALAGASSANAATPPYDPDPDTFSTVTFYDAFGNVVTSGDAKDPLSFTYAQANGPKPAGVGQVAGLFLYDPQPGQPTGLFPGTQLNGNTIYPLAGAPAPVGTSPNPATKMLATSKSMFTASQQFTANTGSLANVWQIRLKLGGSTQYAATSITIDSTTGAWAQVYPAPVAGPLTTTTMLAASPLSPGTAPQDVTLTATVSSSGAGTVQFKQGSTALGVPVATNASGVATKVVPALVANSYSFTADFVPADAAVFKASSSAAVAYVVNAAKTPTGMTLAITPASPVLAGTNATLTATITPAGTAGSVEFFEGGSSLGAAVPVSADKASTTVTALTAGSYSYTATFTPTNSTFATSTSPAQAYVVTVPPATATTTTIAANPTTGIAPATVSLTSTVTPSAAGTVQFSQGSTLVGTASVTAGSATKVLTNVPAGRYSYTATFVPADTTAFSGSMSGGVTVVINSAPVVPAPTTTTTTGTTTTTTATPTATTAPTGTATTAKPSGTATTTAPTGTATTTGPTTAPTTTAPTTAPTGTRTATATATASATGTVTVTVDGKAIGQNPTVAPGTTLTLTASGFAADEMADVIVDGKKIGQVKADAKGAISYVLVVPSDQDDGKVTVDFKGASVTRAFAFTVAADASATPSSAPGSGSTGSSSSTTDAVIAQSGGGSSLPRTGSDVGPLLVTALLLLLVGAAGLVTAQRLRLTRGRHS